MLRREDRERVVAEMTELFAKEPKLHDMIPSVVKGYLHPPQNPDECIFAKTTDCVSSDLKRTITPVPVRRRSGLHAVRLPRVGRPRRARRLQARRRAAAANDLQCIDRGRERHAALAR